MLIPPKLAWPPHWSNLPPRSICPQDRSRGIVRTKRLASASHFGGKWLGAVGTQKASADLPTSRLTCLWLFDFRSQLGCLGSLRSEQPSSSSPGEAGPCAVSLKLHLFRLHNLLI